MGKLTLSMFVTLDGYTAGPSGELGWFVDVDDPELDGHMSAVVRDADALLFGRNTYDMLAGYWPTVDTGAGTVEAELARLLNEIPKHVVTSRPDGLDWTPAAPVAGDLAGEVSRLKQDAGHLLMFGGASTARTLIDLDLVDEYRLQVHPLLLGGGQELLGSSGDQRDLTLIDAPRFERSGAVALHYGR